ncbi:MAG: hypothetical protein V4662_17710 [Verrucomicrobiota bacterium]
MKFNDLGLIAPNTVSGILACANVEDIRASIHSGRVLAAANDANLSGFLLSQPLTQFVSGSGMESRENLAPILERAFPSIPAGDQFHYLVEDETQAGQAPAAPEVKRAIGGEFSVDRPKGTQTAGILDDYGLSMWIDVRQGGTEARVQQRYAMILKNRILRAMLVEGIALLDAAATPDTGKNWGDADADPDTDLAEMIDTSGDAQGVNANRVLYGGGAWLKRLRAYSDAARSNGGARSLFSAEQLADNLNLDDLITLSSRKRTSATAMTKLVNNTVYAYDAGTEMLPTDSSNIKRFVGAGAFGDFQVFVDTTSPTRVLITVYCRALLKITRTGGIRKRAITFS